MTSLVPILKAPFPYELLEHNFVFKLRASGISSSKSLIPCSFVLRSQNVLCTGSRLPKVGLQTALQHRVPILGSLAWCLKGSELGYLKAPVSGVAERFSFQPAAGQSRCLSKPVPQSLNLETIVTSKTLRVDSQRA